jgi:predicted GH43/DUF377 family glycosyl hydrolase
MTIMAKLRKKISIKRKGRGGGKRKKESAPTLSRAPENPILAPQKDKSWESRQTFNPAALSENNKIHLLYRAIGEDGISRLGYAASQDGIHIYERLEEPVFTYYSHPHLREQKDLYCALNYISGGSWAGCEDPRLTLLDENVYMLYTAFDGWNSLRINLTSIKLEDFLNKKWRWKKSVPISPPREIHKNWVLFPEKIKGKYAILHSISPKILIDYIDNLDELNGKKFIKSHWAPDHKRKKSWDNQIRGSGPPPLKTKYGWLLLYHAMDRNDPNRYKLGAMLLDLEDPTKILYRSQEPILEPDECYENEGFKAGVVYSCGAVIVEENLFVFYGGADTVICVATANLEDFLQTLMRNEKPKLKRIKKQLKK